jgi:FMN-dependent NADH-azoreductase
MADTPRTDDELLAFMRKYKEKSDHARQLERELAQANAYIAELTAKVAQQAQDVAAAERRAEEKQR